MRDATDSQARDTTCNSVQVEVFNARAKFENDTFRLEVLAETLENTDEAICAELRPHTPLA